MFAHFQRGLSGVLLIVIRAVVLPLPGIEHAAAGHDGGPVTELVEGILHVPGIAALRAVAGDEEEQAIIFFAERAQHRGVRRGGGDADLGIAVFAELIEAPAHGKVGHDLIDHAVTGEEVLHLAGGFVGAAGNDEDVFAVLAVLREGLDRVAAKIPGHEHAVAGIGREGLFPDLDAAEAGAGHRLGIERHVGAHEIEQDIEAKLPRAGEQIEVQFIMNGSVGGTADAVLGNLQMGNIEMTDFTTTSCGEFSKAYMPLDLFYLVKDFDEMGALLDGPAGDMMNEQFTADTNLKNLTYGILGPRNMTNSKHAITGVADMSGLKMRVQSNQLHMMGMKALGASATNVAFSELFTAMQQGTVDGQENPLDTILQHRYYEVQDYLTITNHLVAVAGLFVNNDWFEGLDPEIQAAFEEAAQKSETYAREAWHAENDATLEELKGLMEVNELDDAALNEFQEAAKSAWTEAAAYIGEEYFNQFLETSGLSVE